MGQPVNLDYSPGYCFLQTVLCLQNVRYSTRLARDMIAGDNWRGQLDEAIMLVQSAMVDEANAVGFASRCKGVTP